VVSARDGARYDLQRAAAGRSIARPVTTRPPTPAERPAEDRLAWHASRSGGERAGVGGSSGMTPDTVVQMARDAIAFLDATEMQDVDLLGFSVGSFVAQEIALIRRSELTAMSS